MVTYSIQQHSLDSNWTRYFNPKLAVNAVMDHLDSLPSARNPEQHTHRTYISGLKYFLGWSEGHLPTEDLMEEFIAHLKRDRGLKSTTVGSRYLAPARLYIRKLARQHIPVSGAERDFVQDCRERIRGAAEGVPNPRPDEISAVAPAYRVGNRLERDQLETLFRSIPRHTIKGRRDLALLYVGFTTGLRVAEIGRMTLNTIEPHEDHYLITVRRKRNKFTPAPLDYDGYNLIQTYIAIYNEPLDDDDPRRITGDIPIWQALRTPNCRMTPGLNGFDPQSGMSRQAIYNMIRQRTQAAVGKALAPHDMRRTVATMAHKEGMPLKAIQKLLAHDSLSTTDVYLGDPTSYDESIISRKKRFAGINDEAYQETTS